jgi:hypothetical protein
MMSPHEFKERVFGRALVLMVGSDLSMKEARELAIKQLAAAEPKVKQGKHPRRSPPAPPPPPDGDLASELFGAKERLFHKLQLYFSAFDRHAAEDKKRARDAKRAARAARKAAKAGPAPRNNVVPLRQADAPQPESAPESSHPTGYLVYAGGSTGATPIEDPFPSPATAGWRASIEHNARAQQQRASHDNRTTSYYTVLRGVRSGAFGCQDRGLGAEHDSAGQQVLHRTLRCAFVPAGKFLAESRRQSCRA